MIVKIKMMVSLSVSFAKNNCFQLSILFLFYFIFFSSFLFGRGK